MTQKEAVLGPVLCKRVSWGCIGEDELTDIGAHQQKSSRGLRLDVTLLIPGHRAAPRRGSLVNCWAEPLCDAIGALWDQSRGNQKFEPSWIRQVALFVV